MKKDNPYHPSTPDHHIWNEGYKACIKDTLKSINQPKPLRDKPQSVNLLDNYGIGT